jgi:hypothetical protein
MWYSAFLSKVQSVEQRMRLGMWCRLSPTADVVRGSYVQQRSFNHLVGTGKQRSGNVDTKLLRSFEVDD